MPAQATAKSVIASANRLIEVRQACLKSSRMAEIRVPAWPIPIHHTKFVMSKAQPTGMLLPQMPMPWTTAPAELRTTLARLNTKQLVERCARFHTAPATSPVGAARRTLRLLARRWQALTTEIVELDAVLDDLTAELAPTLRELPSVGTQTAAILLLAAGDNPDRLEHERSFAALCGTSPIDASSGRQHRHRLNRGGDRNANAALYIIVISRLRWHEPTRAYMQRRLAEGRTKKEVIRCLKRYVARQVHRAILDDLPNISHARPLALAA